MGDVGIWREEACKTGDYGATMGAVQGRVWNNKLNLAQLQSAKI